MIPVGGVSDMVTRRVAATRRFPSRRRPTWQPNAFLYTQEVTSSQYLALLKVDALFERVFLGAHKLVECQAY